MYANSKGRFNSFFDRLKGNAKHINYNVVVEATMKTTVEFYTDTSIIATFDLIECGISPRVAFKTESCGYGYIEITSDGYFEIHQLLESCLRLANLEDAHKPLSD